MTHRRVLEQALSFAVGYVAGLLVLLAWPDRSAAGFKMVLLGFVVAIVVGIAFDWMAYRRAPRLTMRPWRYSIPNAFGIFAALFVFFSSASASQDSERGLIVYALCLPFLAVGVLVSDWIWANAVSHQDTERLGR